MPHLWVEDRVGEWAVVPIEGDTLDVTRLVEQLNAQESLPHHQAEALTRDADCASTVSLDPHRVMLLRAGAHGSVEWLLLAPTDRVVRINGMALPAGIAVLSDRDEIAEVPGRSLFFSTERLAVVEPMPAFDPLLVCPRCKQPIATGSPSVCCPQCGLWYHQTDELPCWRYSSTCSQCPAPTAVDAGFQWTPEEVGA